MKRHGTIRLARAIGIAAWAMTASACAVQRDALSTGSLAPVVAELEAEAQDDGEPLHGKLTVAEAVARAIRYNSALRVSELEVVVETEKARVATAAMLPGVVADSSYYGRGSASSSYTTLSPTIGKSSDLALSWNVLDFGLSFVRAQQQSDKALYQYEAYRKAAQQIASETRLAYWRTVASRKLERNLAQLRGEIDHALLLSDAAAKDTRLDPMTALSYSREILNEQRELNILLAELAGSEAQLRQLVNVGAGRQLILGDDGVEAVVQPPLPDPRADFRSALSNRPEIRQLLYEQRISDDEITSAVLQVLPGFDFDGGFAGSALTVAAGSNWLIWGAKAAWNLIGLARLPAQIDSIDADKAVLKQKTLAMAVAILTQCYVSRDQLSRQRQVYDDARRFWQVQKKLRRQVKIATKLGQSPAQSLTRENVSLLLADIRMMLAYADLEHATGTYQMTIGADTAGMMAFDSVGTGEVDGRVRAPALAAVARSGKQESGEP